MPDPPRGSLDHLGQGVFHTLAVPGTGFGEGLHRLPVVDPFHGNYGLGEGVFLDVEDQGGEPLNDAPPAGDSETTGEAGEQTLPVRPNGCSVHETPSLQMPVGIL